MIYSPEYIKKSIEDFKKRIEEDEKFCRDLFERTTIRLLAFKYSYYVLSKEIVKDDTYDGEEKSWYIMGRALGVIKEDETSPCLDFDERHPLADEGKALAKLLLEGK